MLKLTSTNVVTEYISQAPWYLDTGAPSLSHQRRPQDDRSSTKLDTWYDRNVKAGPAATKYRKGACENCGAITHKKQDCLERPRKKGAKYTNRDIAPDEIIQEVAAGYDAKRDRWNGYDPSEHKKIYEEYEAIEAERQRLREEEIDNQTTTDLAAVRRVAKAGKAEGKEGDADFGSSDEEDADEDKYADSADAVGQKMDTKTRITVRNLRIREDTAKYLINLDPSSAYYDPKTRSMRDNPLKNLPPEEVRCPFTELFFFTARLLPWSLYRLRLLATISCVIPAMLLRYKSSSCSHGRPLLAETTCTSTPTRRKASSCTRSSKKRRKSSRIRRKSACWRSMVARSTFRRSRRSFSKDRRRSTLSILGRVRSSMGRREQRLARSIPKMVGSPCSHSPYHAVG